MLKLPFDGSTDEQKKHDGELGVIRKDGYHALPIVPPSTWGTSGPGDPELDLIVTANDEIWSGRCQPPASGEKCTAWIYARVAPGPLTTTTVAPARAPAPASAP